VGWSAAISFKTGGRLGGNHLDYRILRSVQAICVGWFRRQRLVIHTNEEYDGLITTNFPSSVKVHLDHDGPKR
jgi:hypothetical protein